MLFLLFTQKQPSAVILDLISLWNASKILQNACPVLEFVFNDFGDLEHATVPKHETPPCIFLRSLSTGFCYFSELVQMTESDV